VTWPGLERLRRQHHRLESVPDHQQGWTHFLGVLRDTLSA
jgi:hypothetical protein